MNGREGPKPPTTGSSVRWCVGVSEKKPLLCSTIIFDIIVDVLIFPFFLWLSWSDAVAVSVFTFLIVCHTAIAVVRYKFEREILWPVWAELLVIFSGIILIYSGFDATAVQTIIWWLTGGVLCYGHIRKLIWPNLPYYFSVECVTETALPLKSATQISVLNETDKLLF